MSNLNGKSIPDEFINVSFFSLPQMSMFQFVEKDSAGNYHFIKPGNEEKIQIIFRITPTGVLVGKEEEGKCSVSILGDEKKLTESVLYQQQEPLGVLRREKECWFVEKINKNDDLFMKILTEKQEYLCKDDKLYKNNLCELISLILADFIINNPGYSDKYIDFTVWNSSLTGENGLLAAVNSTNADKILFVSPANKDDFSNESGPAIVLKDGNYILAEEQHGWIKPLNEQGNFYVGKTDSAMEQLDIHLFDKKLLGIYLPISNFGSNVEKIYLPDLKKTQDLLLKCITVL